MALIEKAKGRRENQSPSGYIRLFGIKELGNLMSRIQGAVISSGTELEKLIFERVTKIDDLDQFVIKTLHEKKVGIWIANKKQVKESETIKSKYEPDFLAFDLIKRICYVIEVKDGDSFDTKKSAGEYVTLHNFTNDISQALAFSFQIYVCAFNANTREEIYNGLKRKFKMDEVLTGKELCALFKIDYNKIVKIRTNDQQANIEYFVKQLLAIPKMKIMISKRLNNSNK
ncbi:MAG: restriction endonuclease [Patescibacteria group bacterium]